MALVAVRGFRRSLGTGKSLSFVRQLSLLLKIKISISIYHRRKYPKTISKILNVTGILGASLIYSNAFCSTYDNFNDTHCIISKNGVGPSIRVGGIHPTIPTSDMNRILRLTETSGTVKGYYFNSTNKTWVLVDSGTFSTDNSHFSIAA